MSYNNTLFLIKTLIFYFKQITTSRDSYELINWSNDTLKLWEQLKIILGFECILM